MRLQIGDRRINKKYEHLKCLHDVMIGGILCFFILNFWNERERERKMERVKPKLESVKNVILWTTGWH